jgi:hypothetical protein
MTRVLLGVLVGLSLAGAGWAIWTLVLDDDTRGEGPTNGAEAATVLDIQQRYSENEDTAQALIKACDKSAPNDYRYHAAYQRCFRSDVKPIFEKNDAVTLTALRDLLPEVGPECQRAIRDAMLSMQSEALTIPEDDLADAHDTCREEAEG